MHSTKSLLRISVVSVILFYLTTSQPAFVQVTSAFMKPQVPNRFGLDGVPIPIQSMKATLDARDDIFWDDRFDQLEMNLAVRTMVVNGNDLYVGGNFTQAGGVVANRIAKWDGYGWSPLGDGLSDVEVYSSAVWGKYVYFGASSLARWDTDSNTLSQISGPEGLVWALATDANGNLYAGGNFVVHMYGQYPDIAYNIAKWDGTNWSALGEGVGGSMSYVCAIATSGTDVYVGGGFTSAGGIPVNGIAKWDGVNWSALGSGVTCDGCGLQALTIAVRGNDVYAGGDFTKAGGVGANNIAKWNGSAWSALGNGLNKYVWSMAVSGSDLYVGGVFTSASGVPANGIAKWDGYGWLPLGSGVAYMSNNDVAPVLALAVKENDLYVGGDFGIAGGKSSKKIGRWTIPFRFFLPIISK